MSIFLGQVVPLYGDLLAYHHSLGPISNGSLNELVWISTNNNSSNSITKDGWPHQRVQLGLNGPTEGYSYTINAYY